VITSRLVVSVLLSACVGSACGTEAAEGLVDETPGPSLRPRWTVDVGGPSTSLMVAALTRTVAIVGGNGTLAGVDLRNGRKLWTLPIHFVTPFAGVAVLGDSLAAVVTGDGFVSFDPTTGRVRQQWTNPVRSNAPSQTTPQVLSNGKILFAHRGALLTLDAIQGRLDTLISLPRDSSRGSFVTSLTVLRDTIYAPVATDAARGAAFRNIVIYRYAYAQRHLDSLARDPSDSSSLSRWMVSTDEVLVSATDYSDPSWLGFDRRTGARRWKVPAQPGSLGPSSQVAVAGDTMFAAGNDGVGYVFRVSTGQKIRTFEIASGLAAGVAACRNTVLVNVIGELRAFARDRFVRVPITGMKEGQDSFLGAFAVGSGVAVIGVGNGTWVAFDCE
jgi:outer membrane protein assembly factor BamB